MTTRIMDNPTQKKYCKKWSGGWVVAGVRGAYREEMDLFHTEWPLAEPDVLMDEDYLKRRSEAWDKLQNAVLNISRDFSTEEEARSWMVECAKHRANYLVCLSPDTYDFCLDSMDDDNKIRYMHMNYVAQHVRWLMGE